MRFRIFISSHEFVGVAQVLHQKGRLYGPPEDCYQEDFDISIEEISMKNGCRKRLIDWDSLDMKVQDRILDEISEDWTDGIAADRAAKAEFQSDLRAGR